MKFSTRTTYGLRAIIKLAKNYKKGYLSLKNISKEENISLGYLERLFSRLKKYNLIISEIGIKGGYSLARPPKKINILEIVEALEGEIIPFKCLVKTKKIKCREKKNCKASMVLSKVQNSIKNTLKNIKLNELL